MQKRTWLSLFLGLNSTFLPLIVAASCKSNSNSSKPGHGNEKPTPDPGMDVTPEPVIPGFGSGNPNQPTANILGKPAEAGTTAYQNASEYEKYQFDEKAYLDALRGKLKDEGINLNLDRFDEKSFNQNASINKHPKLESAVSRNFSTPDKDGNLILSPIQDAYKLPYWQSTQFDRGRARNIPNNYYKDILLQSYSINFINNNELIGKDGMLKQFNGTAWILDYQLDENGQYPTKWYLATNLHVAQSLIKSASNSVNDRYQNIENKVNEADKYNDLVANSNKWANKYLELEKQLENQSLTADQKAELNTQLEEALIQYNVYEKARKQALSEVFGETRTVRLQKFNEETPLNSSLKTTDKDPHVYTFDLDPSQVKIVYAAMDFLKTSPSSFLGSNNKYSNLEEMADFAILEIDFNNSNNNYPLVIGGNFANKINISDPYTYAKLATSEYANWESSRKSKPANFSILEKYDELQNEKIQTTWNNQAIEVSRMNLNFLALGFPTANSDDQISDYKTMTESEKRALDFTTSLWINKPKDNSVTIENYGYSLSKSLAFRNFEDKPGITDITITNPLIDQKNGFKIYNFKDTKSQYKDNEYMYYGLGYVLNTWEPLQGASGSSIRDINNNIIGINYASGDSLGVTLVSLIQALRSNGHNYNGTYGKYNLEQYDLIYGGGLNQRTSYRDAMLEKYGAEFKTYLFNEGLGKMPNEYKFN